MNERFDEIELLVEIDRVKRALAALAYKGVGVDATLTYTNLNATVVDHYDSDSDDRLRIMAEVND